MHYLIHNIVAFTINTLVVKLQNVYNTNSLDFAPVFAVDFKIGIYS